MNELWSYSQREEWNQMYYRSLDLSMKIYLAKLSEKNMPKLELKADDGSWTNNKIIHIGNGKLSIHDTKEMMLWTSYLLGHEMQHVLSTTDKSWTYGLESGVKAILEEFARKTEQRPRRFIKDSDYERYLEELQKRGYHISKSAMQKFVHFIVNSLEDGRIERIRCIKNPGFLNYVKICRGQSWEESPLPEEMKKDLDDPRTYISVLLNQILTLATMSIYQKGFGEIAAEHAQLHLLIQKSIPHIKKAVNSPTCRGCMEEAIAICKILAPEIMEACKLTPLEELLSNLLRTFAEEQSFVADSRTEETGEGGIEIKIFGISDMESSSDENIQETKGQNPSGNGNDGASEEAAGESMKGNPGEDKGTEEGTSDKNPGSISEKISEAVSSAMQDAYKDSQEEMELAVHSGRVPKKEVPKTPIIRSEEDVLPDLSSVDQVYSGQVQFHERKRTYKPDIKMPTDILARAKNLKRKVEKIFKSQDIPSLRGQSKGKIDAPKVYKLAMNQMDFFKRNQQMEPFEGCTYLLMDNSGSMGNGKGSTRYYGCTGGAIIEHAFSDYVLMKIVAFDASGSNDVTHKVIKDWHEKVPANATWNFYEQDTCGNGNKDGYSIRVATQELLARSEKNKLLIVISDGLPSAYNGRQTGMKDVQEAVKAARKYGIKVVSMYLSSDVSAADTKAFQEMYETNAIVTTPENMEQELVRIMKRFCFR